MRLTAATVLVAALPAAAQSPPAHTQWEPMAADLASILAEGGSVVGYHKQFMEQRDGTTIAVSILVQRHAALFRCDEWHVNRGPGYSNTHQCFRLVPLKPLDQAR